MRDMAEKIRVACEARHDPQNMLIIARTDARQSEGLDGALRRAEAYRRAGADIIFVEALTSEEEMRFACQRIEAPMMANMADGGLTPILPAQDLADIGYAFAIYPSMTSLVAAAAMETALRRLKEDGLSQTGDIPMFDFKTFCSLIGFEDVWAFERKWGARSWLKPKTTLLKTTSAPMAAESASARSRLFFSWISCKPISSRAVISMPVWIAPLPRHCACAKQPIMPSCRSS